MALSPGTVYVNVKPDTSAMTGAGSSSLAGSMAKAGALAGVALAGAAAVAIAKFAVSAVTEAASVGESLNKNRVLFEGSAAIVAKWSKSTANSFGISRSEALAATGTFGGLFEAANIANKPAAEMSVTMVQLAADMASFNNASPEETLLALRSGLSGESEPLRKFAVFLNDAAIEQEGVRMGLIKVGQTMTDQQKIQARYNFIMRKTTKQQDDFKNTSGSLPNLLRRMNAGFDNIQGTIGKALLPTVRDLIDRVSEFTQTKEFQGWMRDAKAWVTKAATAVGEFFGIVEDPGHVLDKSGRTVRGFAGKLKSITTSAEDAKSGIEKLLDVLDRLFKVDLNPLQSLADGFNEAGSAAHNFIGDVIGNGGSGNQTGGPIPGPAGRALGGPVRAGLPYLVGERGPELIVPRHSGYVVPNFEGGRGGERVVFVDTQFGKIAEGYIQADKRYAAQRGRANR